MGKWLKDGKNKDEGVTMEFQKLDDEIAELEAEVSKIEIPNDEEQKSAQTLMTYLTKMREELLRYINSLESAVLRIQDKIRTYESSKQVSQSPTPEEPSASSFDDFDAEPLTEEEELIAEINKTQDELF